MQTSFLTQTKNDYFAQFCKQSKVTASLVLLVSAMSYLSSANAVESAISQNSALPTMNLSSEQMEALAIKTQTVAAVTSYPSSAFIAESIVPINQRYVVTMPMSGQITALHHVHGHVDKGDLIATVYSSELQKLQSDFVSTLADLKAEIAALKRAKSLSQTGAISSKQRQQLEASVRKLSQLKSQQKQNLLFLGMNPKSVETLENTQQIQSAELDLVAPVTGELFDVKVKIGERVAEQSVVVSIAQTNPIVIDLEVPIADANTLSEGQSVSVVDVTKQGKVAHIADFVNPMTQSVEVHTVFDNADFAIKPGQLFKVHFQYEQPAYQTALGALTTINSQDIIFVQQSAEIKAIPIHVLQTHNGQLFFTPVKASDINENSVVVIHGASSLKNSLMAEEGEE
ncbi:efflux RND transporter periplasmic adaptor subunit [Thiomicrorhabdus sp. Kp2]|uniref:efflux RND transporter periplasmic adaptor subunit n=1 Tax=Thiomicrorhabdus sp. Kp2 TaxID=1123518 RepID=UPI0004285753|nr:efflux RND transporter periplasmic adaptor subunit [Thiomicrorhabdus sp. Kp2]